MHTGARPLEQKEVTALINAFEGEYRLRNRAMVQVGLYTGLRLGSILALKIGDVWDGQKFRDRIRVARRFTKGRRAGLDMPLYRVASIAIAQWLVKFPSAGAALYAHTPLFASRERGGAPLRSRAQEIVNTAARKAGLELGASTHSWQKMFFPTDYIKQPDTISWWYPAPLIIANSVRPCTI